MSLLERCPVVPVVVLDSPDQALPLRRALLAGGMDVVEVTLRTPQDSTGSAPWPSWTACTSGRARS